MSSGLIAILDDVVGLAKVAAASLDDAAAQAGKAGSKAIGIVIDDAAVTPRYAVGFAAERELPIIGKIARGSLWNKVVVLLPGALLLSLFAPWAITPLLMLGGAYLCLEGYGKVVELAGGAEHGAHAHGEDEARPAGAAETPEQLEAVKVASAIRTDFILSAEIMAITLAAVEASPFWTRAAVLAIVGVGMTALVYGLVAIIVKADDAGLAMARSPSRLVAGLGRLIVRGMPGFLVGLSIVGMAAMLWVGGGILVHGLAGLGWPGPEQWIHHVSEIAARAVPVAPVVAGWFTGAAISGVAGLAVGAACAPVAHRILLPLYRKLTGGRGHG
jgi:predicted DNA repair protein MutK